MNRDKILAYIIENWDSLKVEDKDYVVEAIIDREEDRVFNWWEKYSAQPNINLQN